jgi:hypothetical protein
MTNTYTWIVEYMSCYPQAEGETDVVFTVGWRCNATDGTFNATQYGSVGVPYVAGNPYTPYAQLTQDQVLGWVWENGVDKDAVQVALDTNIANQVNPPVVNPPLPWSA